MESLGKWVMVAGAVVVVLGAALWFAGRLGLPLGSFPGDVHAEKGQWSFHFPVVTCIIASVVITIILNVIVRLLR